MTSAVVLVVDDDPALRQAVGVSLTSEGYEVRNAGSGEMALITAAASRPDLILLDVVMPGIDGFATLDMLRQDPELADVPVVIVSAMESPVSRARAIEMGADDFVVKPYHWPELLARIRRLLERARRSVAQMSGRLDDVSLPELLQTLDLGRKAARVWLRDVGGEIVVSTGALVDARWHAFRGVEALERLILVARGAYSVRFGASPHSGADACSSLGALLLRMTTRVDETLRDVARFCQLEARVRVNPDWPRGHAFDSLREVASLRAIEVLALLAGDPRANVRALEEALRDGALQPAGDQRVCSGDGEGG